MESHSEAAAQADDLRATLGGLQSSLDSMVKRIENRRRASIGIAKDIQPDSPKPPILPPRGVIGTSPAQLTKKSVESREGVQPRAHISFWRKPISALRAWLAGK